MLVKVCLWLLLLYPTFVVGQTLPNNWKTVGQATLKILWFNIYKAELQTAEGKYSGFEGPLILKLNYLRNISKQQLLEETNKQLQLFVSEEQASVWSNALEPIWPAIKKGDQLAFWIDFEGTGHFFLKEAWIGSVKDPAFSSGFVQIWLSTKSNYPNLAKRLRGEPENEIFK